MLAEFKRFLLKTNAFALAIGVIIGGAVGKVVESLVKDVLMPLIGLGLPGGDWRDAKIVLSKKLDGTPAPPPPPTKPCPECTEALPIAAKRCKFCTSPV
jgi:large conductance mechanosensitive channel